MQSFISLFSTDVLAAWSRLASTDEMVHQHSALADLDIGFRNTETSEQAWLQIDESGIYTGLGAHTVAFSLVGDTEAFTDLIHGFPFNRLIRQHRLFVEGDLRCCVQNWMLLYALTRLTKELEI